MNKTQKQDYILLEQTDIRIIVVKKTILKDKYTDIYNQIDTKIKAVCNSKIGDTHSGITSFVCFNSNNPKVPDGLS
jgi:hypothetical protein